MTGTEIINLIAAQALPLLPSGFVLVKDQNRPWTPTPGAVKLWVEPLGWQQTTIDGKQGKRAIKATFAAYVAENTGMGPVTDFTDALAHGVTGPFKLGTRLATSPASLEVLNSRAPSTSWTEGKDSRAHPGLFAACALVTLDHYANAA